MILSIYLTSFLNTLMSENEISKVNITEPFIIAARELYPSDTLSFTKENILGIITSVGSFLLLTHLLYQEFWAYRLSLIQMPF